MKRTALSMSVLAVLLSGCASWLAPDYQPPASPVPAAWPTGPAYDKAGTDTSAASVSNMPWQTFIRDERLQKLVSMALANNRDLRIATLNIEKSRAQYGIARANLLPSIGLTANGTHAQTATDLTPSGAPRISHAYTAGVGFTSWELDFFGKIQNQKNQAFESYLQQAELRNAAQISLIAEVSNAWLTLAADQEQRKLAQDTLQSQTESYRLTRSRFDLGVATQLDLSQAESTVDTAKVDVASLTAQVAQDQNALTLLVGAPVPAALLPQAGLFDGPAVLAPVPVGLSSDVLLNRPDLRADEHALRAANANIGAARAAFFPSITLTGSVGSGSNDMSRLFSGGNGTWSFMPQLTLPIFNAGALMDSLDVAKVSRDITVAQYEKDIQTAFRETANALAVRGTIADQLKAQQAVTDATGKSFRLSTARYDNGIDGYLTLLDAQRSLYAAQQKLIATKLAKQSNLVTLYKVLGGGLAEGPAAVDNK